MLLCLRSQATRGVRFSQSLQRGQRGKVDLSRFPPWRRWPKAGIQRIKNWKLPEVEPAFDLFACDDPKLVADALSEVVPWKRKRFHHEWLHRACVHLRTLLPEMEPPDVLRVILAFGELYTKRRRHSLLFQDYETYTQLFQALPIDVATEKSLLPLMRCYRRMGVLHEPFVSAICNRVVEGEVELTPSQLSELVQIHGDLKIRSPRLFTFASEMLDLRFAYFSEDQVGDIARTFCQLRHHCPVFLATLRRELPMRLHEYAWWNLIDIGEMYLYLQVDDRDIIERIANEVYKLIFSMKYSYPARALKIFAFLDVGDKRTLRLLIRSVPRTISFLTPQGAAETLIAFATLDVKPKDIFHRVRAWKIYLVLMKKLLPNIGSLSPKMTCDVLAAVAKAGQKEAEFVQHVEAAVNERPYKYHAEHLISMLRDLSLLKAASAPLRTHLMQRHFELADCTPSALCALPTALAGHPAEGDQEEMEHKMLTTMSQLLTKPGAYKLPKDGRMFRAKDDFWWEQLRQRHFRLRRRAKEAGVTVAPAPKSAAEDEDADEAAPAVIHVTRQECLQLVQGCAKMGWHDESLLQGTAAWLCEGRRHAELSPSEVASLLGAFSELGYSSPLLRAALEHALLRVASAIPPASCTEAVQGAVDAGMSVRSTAVRSLLKRCTSQLRQLPEKDAEKLRELAGAILKEAEEEVLHSQGAIRLPRAEPLRLPLDLQLFREAVATQLGPTVSSG